MHPSTHYSDGLQRERERERVEPLKSGATSKKSLSARRPVYVELTHMKYNILNWTVSCHIQLGSRWISNQLRQEHSLHGNEKICKSFCGLICYTSLGVSAASLGDGGVTFQTYNVFGALK